jgi:hypothetical protein
MESVSFDLDCSMMLPLSLPTTPFDLDIAQGLEQLRSSPVDGNFIVPEIREPEPQQQHPQPQQVVDDIFSPTFTTSPTSFSEEKMLKSRWSTSTLGSIREEHENRGTSSKLRLYFSPLKTHKHRSSKKSPTTSSSPARRHKTPATSSSCSSTPSPAPARSPTRAHHTRGYSDVMVIGYGNNGNGSGIRRRGSVTNSVSDAGSEESYSSTSSSGLRRKPIPVEMFLRSAV